MKQYLLISLLLGGLFPWLLSAQGGISDVSKTGTVAAPFLEISVGAQAVGMGGAVVSVAKDATAIYWNVAGIAGLKKREIVSLHTRWIAGTGFDFAALVLPMGNFGTLGFSFTSLSMDEMSVRTVEKPEGTGEFFDARDIAIGASYARMLTDRFSIGFSAKYIQQKIWHMTANGFALDAGTAFRTDLFGGMIIGASISNFGGSMKLSGRDTRQFGRIDDTKLGSNDRIPSNIELDSWDLPLLFQFGVSANALNNDNYRWTIAIDALHPVDNYESVNIGTEFGYNDFFFLRGGYNALFLDEAEGGLSLGFGLTTSTLISRALIKIDYAYRDMGRLESVNVFSLGIAF